MDILSRKVFSNSIRRCAIELTTKRYRGKINLKRPRVPHFERALTFEFAKPKFPSKIWGKTIPELCNINVQLYQKTDAENPYQRILANDLKKQFESSKMICFYHSNPVKEEDKFKAHVLFKKQNMLFKNYGVDTVKMAIKNTKFEPVLQLYQSHNMTLFSPEMQIAKMLSITKKFPQFVLLAAVIEGKFFSRDEIDQLSLIPDLKTAQVVLLQTLQAIGGNLNNQLTTIQNNLINQLNERIKQLEMEEKKN